MARTTSTATTTAPAAANIALVTETEGRFDFVTAANVLHDAHVAARPAPVVTRGASRERFTEDEQLISFIAANQWNDLKTQKILDSLRAQGRACGMSRLNKLLGRDAKGNPVPVEAAKAE